MMRDENLIPDEETARLKQMEMTAAEDQWRARWDLAKPPPGNGMPDIRPIVHQHDRTLLAAAKILEMGVTLSPATVQILTNALYVYQAGLKLDSGELSPEAFEDFVGWLYGPETEPPTDQNDPKQ